MIQALNQRHEDEKTVRCNESLLLESQKIAGIGHYFLDVSTGIWTSSPMLDQIFGISADHPKTVDSWAALLHEDDREQMVAYFLNDVVGRKQLFDREYRIIRLNDGAVRWVHGLGRLEIDASGSVISMFGTIQDITDRHLQQLALRESEEKFRTIFERAGEGILLTDLETGRFLIGNPAICNMLGYTAQEIRGLGVDDIHPKEAMPRVIADFEALTREEKVLALNLPCRRKDGTIFFADISRTKSQWDGRPCRIGFYSDATERRQLEREKLAMERRLLHSQKLESLGLLAGGIAHDFNNLLMAVLGQAQLARLKLPATCEARPNLAQIDLAVNKAADLARQLLAYSGKGKFVIEVHDLNQIVQEITHLMEVSISKKIQLRFHLGKDLPAFEADGSQIRQIIMNLVINASEAIGDHPGAIAISTGKIWCDPPFLQRNMIAETLAEGLYLLLEISDTGCGMAPETLARLFDPFFSTKFAGRGLGLAAVMGIIRGHKGLVKVYSEPGKGTTFKVFLPASEKPVSSRGRTCENSSWKGHGTVLFVDDEEHVRTTGRAMLEELGFSVVLAENGCVALQKFVELGESCRLVILDLTMPIMDGMETLMELKAIHPAVPVVLSSGYNELEVSQRFVGKGLTGFVQKPYSMAGLQQVIQATLESGPEPEEKS